MEFTVKSRAGKGGMVFRDVSKHEGDVNDYKVVISSDGNMVIEMYVSKEDIKRLAKAS